MGLKTNTHNWRAPSCVNPFQWIDDPSHNSGNHSTHEIWEFRLAVSICGGCSLEQTLGDLSNKIRDSGVFIKFNLYGWLPLVHLSRVL